MTIDLKPSQEKLVYEALPGRYQNVDEFLNEALSA
jgi:hypothetical protein